MLPETLAANALPAASSATARIALGSSQPRSRLNENAMDEAAGMSEENLATMTLLSGLPKHDTVPEVPVEANGVR